MPRSLVVCRTLDDLTRSRRDVTAIVRETGYCVIRGLFDAASVRTKLRPVYDFAHRSRHRASMGVPPSDVRKNMSKWSIGGHSTNQAGIARFMLSIYNPLLDEDIFGLHPDFRKMIEIRDIVGDRPILDDAALLPTHYNACRIHLYPAGGGFMTEHIDRRGAKNLAGVGDGKAGYLQILLLLTQKGIDFREGGGVVTRGAETVDTELDSMSGDVVVYDGDTSHGVKDVDPTVPFDPSNLRGRAAAIVTIYNNEF